MNVIQIDNHHSDVHTQQAYWLAVILPYAIVDPLARSKLADTGGPTFLDCGTSESQKNPTKIDGIYVLDDEINRWSVTTNKSSPMGGLSMTLRYGQYNWLQKIMPGDWCLFWCFEDKASYEKTLGAIRSKYQLLIDSDYRDLGTTEEEFSLNDFDSGLKFIGRLTSIRQSVQRSPGGEIEASYAVSAASFTEMNSVLFYDPVLAFSYQTYTQFLEDFGVGLDVLFSGKGDNQGFVNITKLVPTLGSIILGSDPKTIDSKTNDPLKATLVTKFKIPQILGDILNLPQASSVDDIHRYYSGRQTYASPGSTFGSNGADFTTPTPWGPLIPKLANRIRGNTYLTTEEFNDKVNPSTFDISGQSCWSIMRGYINEPINEMYTALRPEPGTGRLLPSIVIRTNPLTSEDLTNNLAPKGVKLTPFSAYPAWQIDMARVTSFDVGRSDNARFNSVQIESGDKFSSNEQQNLSSQRIFAPPASIPADIARNGLRRYVQKVTAQAFDRTVTAKENRSRVYTSIMGDILLDSHLRLSGNVDLEGVQLPISHGDNAIINGLMFHIESVSHSGGIIPGGEKMFSTSLSLSHGVPLDTFDQSGDTPGRFQTDPSVEITFGPPEYESLSKARNSRTDLKTFEQLTSKVVKIDKV